jgi:hypothetical protein
MIFSGNNFVLLIYIFAWCMKEKSRRRLRLFQLQDQCLRLIIWATLSKCQKKCNREISADKYNFWGHGSPY